MGLVSDLCRALSSNILIYCDEIMQLLLENLGVSRRTPIPNTHTHPTDPFPLTCLCVARPQNENVHRSVKPQILSVFGDIAMAIGGEFKKYLEIVLDTLQQASQAQVDKVGQPSPPRRVSRCYLASEQAVSHHRLASSSTS